MSGSDGKTEPSMDEILASIKKIISEEPKTGEAEPAPQKAVGANNIDASLDSLLKAQIDSAPNGAHAHPVHDPNAAPKTPAGTPAPTEASPGSTSDATPRSTGPLVAKSISQPTTDEIEAIRRRARQAAGLETKGTQPDTQAAGETSRETAPPSSSDPTPTSQSVEVPAQSSSQAAPTSPQQPDASTGDPQTAASLAPNGSPVTQSMSTAAPTPAAQADAATSSEATSQTAPIQSRTIEDTVTELLRPMLREWLDSNLPTIIEKVVKDDIAKRTTKLFDGEKKP